MNSREVRKVASKSHQIVSNTPPVAAELGKKMKKDRRWLKSALAAAAEPQVALPWARGSRRRPASLKAQSVSAKTAPIAAR